MELTPIHQPNFWDSCTQFTPMQVAIFMSGSGTNALKILESWERIYNEKKRFIDAPFKRLEEQVVFEPALIFTDNSESKAAEIAKEYQKKEGLALALWSNPISQFFQRNKRSIDDRKHYDSVQKDIAKGRCIDLVALAGYDWVVTEEIHKNFITVNVHPGDLREKNEKGEPKYAGLGWIPSAKAILDGKNEVYTSVHLVTEELDGGPILAVSAPQAIPAEAAIKKRKQLLGEGLSLKEVITFVKLHSDLPESEINTKFPIVGYARDCQDRLKRNGDWVVFPQVIEDIARGRYARDEEEKLYFDGQPIETLNFREGKL